MRSTESGPLAAYARLGCRDGIAASCAAYRLTPFEFRRTPNERWPGGALRRPFGHRSWISEPLRLLPATAWPALTATLRKNSIRPVTAPPSSPGRRR